MSVSVSFEVVELNAFFQSNTKCISIVVNKLIVIAWPNCNPLEV